MTQIAWEAYREQRKAPKTRKAGRGFASPDYDLSVDWFSAEESIDASQKRQSDPIAQRRILLINGSPRSELQLP